ncbi:MAG TPA: ATP-binding cassette domain-containing protein [Clostridiaceae bacterium]|nr:ATP-binding cassette domain-containing protein [Clostridiaceae bacterium]
MNQGRALLTASHLSKHFTTEDGLLHAVNDVSFEVKQGEIFGFIGLSGAGKSTLVRCLNLLERPDAGQIIFDGQDMTELNPQGLILARRKMGMIFQHFNLFLQKSVYQNIAYPLYLAGEKEDRIRDRVMTMLDYVDLKDKSAAYPSELSGGQKQRVAIARALAANPKLILSDEGTSALDPETTRSILTLLRKSVQDLGVTVILITHQMEVAKSICDRIAVMEDGRLIEEGPVEQLFVSPKQQRTIRFIQTLEDEIGEQDLKALSGGRVFRLTFPGESARQPILSNLIRRFDVEVNVLAGNINVVRSGKIGYLTIEMAGDPAVVEAGLQFLTDQDVNVEEVKHG